MNSRTFGVLKKGGVLLLKSWDDVKEFGIFLKPIVGVIIDKKHVRATVFMVQYKRKEYL